jgi:hypothetical protein
LVFRGPLEVCPYPNSVLLPISSCTRQSFRHVVFYFSRAGQSSRSIVHNATTVTATKSRPHTDSKRSVCRDIGK